MRRLFGGFIFKFLIFNKILPQFTGLELTPQADNGLVFYFGPMSYSPKLEIQDFMSLEIQKGYPVLYVDYGTGTVRLERKEVKLTDGKSHRIDVYWTKTVSNTKNLYFWTFLRISKLKKKTIFKKYYFIYNYNFFHTLLTMF